MATSDILQGQEKFNLDGADGMLYHLHDIKTEKRINVSRQMNGGSVMIWAAFTFNGRS